MKALFLAGGMGTRLRPLTDKLPKPMVPVMGKPLLERNIKRLKTFGINEIVLSTCYRSEHFEDYFNRVDTGVHISFVPEEVPMGTGGAIKNAERFFDDTFLVFNADIISDLNISEMLSFHKSRKADVTIAITHVKDPTRYGVIEFDDCGYALTFKEKPQPHEVVSNYINAGVYIFEPDVLKMIPKGRPVSVEREIFPKMLNEGKRIAVYKGCNYWIDLGTPEKYIQVHQDIFEGHFIMDDANFCNYSLVGLSDAKVHASAVLRGPVLLGAGCRIGAEAVIGPNVVVGANCVIGKKCIVENSILWDEVTLEQNNRVSDSVITSGCFVEFGIKIVKSIFTGEVHKRLAV